MEKCLLYGNGLSLALLNIIRSNVEIPFIEYLDSTKFLEDLINAKDHQRIYRKFIKFFHIDQETIIAHEQVRCYLKKHIKEIKQLGFERWVGKYYFIDNDLIRLVKPYLYFVYNYWYATIFEEIISNKQIQEIIKKSSEIVYSKDTKYYTTNFDTFFDKQLNPDHIHGKFIEKLESHQDIVAFTLNEKEFEYVYLFGTNGYEKYNRLKIIHEHDHKNYDLNFFYNDKITFENLIIFGIAFGNAEMFTQEFHQKYPKHDEEIFFNSVDGHILKRFEDLKNQKRLIKLTLCYHTEYDYNYYRIIMKYTSLESIIEYISCNEVINLDAAF